MDEGRDEGLIEFEVGGEIVEVEVEGFEMEWGIEAERKLCRITLRKGRVSNNVGIKTDVYSATPSSRFRWRFNRLCFGTIQPFEEVLCEGSARRNAGGSAM